MSQQKSPFMGMSSSSTQRSGCAMCLAWLSPKPLFLSVNIQEYSQAGRKEGRRGGIYEQGKHVGQVQKRGTDSQSPEGCSSKARGHSRKSWYFMRAVKSLGSAGRAIWISALIASILIYHRRFNSWHFVLALKCWHSWKLGEEETQ